MAKEVIEFPQFRYCGAENNITPDTKPEIFMYNLLNTYSESITIIWHKTFEHLEIIL